MQLLVGVKIEHSKSKYCSLFTFDEITPPFFPGLDDGHLRGRPRCPACQVSNETQLISIQNARQLDRQINEELKRAKHQMVVGKIFQIKYKDLALGREYTGLKHRIR